MPTINPKFLDLSHYDHLADVNAVKAAGIRGIVNKATEGPGMVDKTFAQRRAVVLGAGLLYGAYHFLRPGDPAAQAEHFLHTIGDPAGLLLMLDHEIPAVPIDNAKAWLAYVHGKIDRWPVLYSYSAMLFEQLGTTRPDPQLAQVRLWVAAYNDHPQWPTQIWPKYWGWQFTGDGNGLGPKQIPGVVLPGARGIDINSYDGSDDKLAAEWAS